MAGDVHPDDFYRWLDAPPPMLTGVPCVIISKVEHDALRQRASDLELMLRADMQDPGVLLPSEGGGFFLSPDLSGAQLLEDDGTGLPLLTAEARSALLRAVKGG